MSEFAHRAARVLALVPIGAACGVVVAVLTMAGLALSAGELPRPGGMVLGALGGIWFGAPVGAVIGPAIGTLLRDRVPMGRLIATTVSASIVGAVLGTRLLAALRIIDGAIIAAIPGALIACLGAAVWLHLRSGKGGTGSVPSRRILIGALLFGMTLAGCSPSTLFTGCTDDLQQTLEPRSTTLDAGDTVRARAEFLGCRGTKRLTDEITWSSQDPAVATVEPTTGLITARGAGTTTVTPTGARYGALWHVSITVR